MSVTCYSQGCQNSIELTDASSLLWKLQNLYNATTAVASDATEYWAGIAVNSKNPTAPLAHIAGGFSALWTPGVAPTTAITLGTAGFGFMSIPKNLTHFTTVTGARGIFPDAAINPSLNMMKNALFGPGVYLSKIGRPINMLISKKSLTPIIIAAPAGTVRIIPYLVYVRWGVAPLAVEILNK